MEKYNHKKIEEKWRTQWEKSGLYKTDLKNAKRPFYNLTMFPYPSNKGLHMGNMYPYIGCDTFGRYMRLRGYDVFEPMGFDAFGIHGENYALKVGRHPKEVMEENVTHFRENQLKKLGMMFDWDHEVNTSDSHYYKWTQWIFLQLLKAGLAERKLAPVNWCPSCKTVLADEQVIGGECERCGSQVELRELTQWFFKITNYAHKLYSDLPNMDWSKKTLDAQKNWIGESKGVLLKFKLDGLGREISVFTTRIDTVYGVTFVAIPADSEIISFIENKDVLEAIENLRGDMKKGHTNKEKLGVFTGLYAQHPLTGDKVPIWVTNYVLSTYGTGMVMGVPAEDERDAEFAHIYGIPTLPVYEDEKLVNSEKYNGLRSEEAKSRILQDLSAKGIASESYLYKLRDWLISRQRYWGPPIPVIYCKKCGIVPLEESELPLLLPESADVAPSGTEGSPLSRVPDFVNTTCPICGSAAKRDTDVMDNFLDSAWYYLRYPSSDRDDVPFDPELTKKWLPVDLYIGGNEHAVLHLMYTRFIVMALHDLGFIDFDEPFKKFRANGIILSQGMKMSKSKGNVVNPEEYIERYGADATRMYLFFMGPYEQGGDFQDRGILGIVRFINSIYTFFSSLQYTTHQEILTELDIEVNSYIKSISYDIENLGFNTGVSSLMKFLHLLQEYNGKWTQDQARKALEVFVLLLSPFAPYLAEELWVEKLGQKYSVFDAKWPEMIEGIQKKEKVLVQVNNKVKGVIEVDSGISLDEIMREARAKVEKFAVYTDNQIIDTIYKPGKVINIVTKE